MILLALAEGLKDEFIDSVCYGSKGSDLAIDVSERDFKTAFRSWDLTAAVVELSVGYIMGDRCRFCELGWFSVAVLFADAMRLTGIGLVCVCG